MACKCVLIWALLPVALCLPRLTRPPPSVLAARAWRSFRQRVELGSVIINCLIGEHLPLYFPVSANIRHASFMMNASPCFSGRPDKVWTRCAQRPEETSGSFSYFILRCKLVLVTLGVAVWWLLWRARTHWSALSFKPNGAMRYTLLIPKLFP